MQDTLEITVAGYEYDFMWLYSGYSILVQWKDTTQVLNSGVIDWDRPRRAWRSEGFFPGVQ